MNVKASQDVLDIMNVLVGVLARASLTGSSGSCALRDLLGAWMVALHVRILILSMLCTPIDDLDRNLGLWKTWTFCPAG